MKERLITDQYDGYEFAYPEILELSDRQLKDNFWLSTEYDVGLDRLELRYDLAEGLEIRLGEHHLPNGMLDKAKQSCLNYIMRHRGDEAFYC